jgi:O-antigen ligase
MILSYTFTSRESIRPPLYAYTLGAVVICLILIGNYLVGNSFNTGRYTAGSINPNTVAFSLVFSIPCILYLSRSAKAKIVQIIIIGVGIIISSCVILTGSRTAYVGLATILLYFTVCTSTFKPKRRIPAVVIFVVASTGLLFFFLPAEFVARFSSIPKEVLQGDLATRTVQWSGGLDLLKSNPILGVGLGAFPQSVEQIIGYSVAPDNTHLQIIYETGFIGIIFSVLLLRTVFSTILSSQKSYIRIEFGALVASCLIMGLANDFAYNPIFWSLLSLFVSENVHDINDDID